MCGGGGNGREGMRGERVGLILRRGGGGLVLHTQHNTDVHEEMHLCGYALMWMHTHQAPVSDDNGEFLQI